MLRKPLNRLLLQRSPHVTDHTYVEDNVGYSQQS